MVAILDEKSLSLIREGYKFCNICITGPYRWESNERAPASVSRLRPRLPWFVNILLVVIQATFTIAQLWRIGKTDSVVYKIYILFSAAVYTYSVLFQVANILIGCRLPHFVASYILFFNGLQRLNIVKTRAELIYSTRCKCVLVAAFCAFRPLPILVSLMAIVKPTLPDLWTSILSDPYSLPWMIQIGMGLLQGYIFFILTDTGVLWLCSGFPFLITAADLLNILKRNVGAAGGHGTTSSLPFAEVKHVYEKLRLFVMEYDQIFMIVLIACKVCLISLATFCTCGAVRSHGVLALFLLIVSIISIFCLIVYQMLLGDLNHRSRLFLKAIKIHVAAKYACPKYRKTDLDYTCRYLLRIRELRVQMGSVYYVEKPIVLTIFKIMFDSVINFLILSK